MFKRPGGVAPGYGDADHVYGRFRLRRRLSPASTRLPEALLQAGLFLVLRAGEAVDGYAEGDEILFTTISPNTTDLRDVLSHLHLALEREQEIIARQRERIEWLRTQQDPLIAGAPAAEPACDDDTSSISEQIADEEERIRYEEARYEAVERAVRELEAQHSDLDVGAHLQAYRERLANPPIARELAERQRRAQEWWHHPDQGAEWAQDHVLGDVVAQHGRFSVYEAFSIAPDGSRWRMPTFEVRLVELPTPVFVVPFGIPATPRSDRKTTTEYVEDWQHLLRESIQLGYAALAATNDVELSAKIQDGIRERERQHQVVERALRELRQ